MAEKITLPTSPEVREKLEKAGYTLWGGTNREERWEYDIRDGIPSHVLRLKVGCEPYLSTVMKAPSLSDWLKVALIFGSAPGYRLVPEDVAVATARFIRLWTDPSTMALGRPDPATVGTLKALATALEGKDESHG